MAEEETLAQQAARRNGLARDSMAWILGLLVLGLPAALVVLFGSEDLQGWIGVYIAGAMGGLVMELTSTRGQLELPSAAPLQRDAPKHERSQIGNPLGRQMDLGFFARMFLGALAAFTIILIAKFLASGAQETDGFSTSATSVATLAWAVAIGFTSPAAWAATKKLAEARYKAMIAVKDEQTKQKDKALAAARKLNKGTLDRLREAGPRSDAERHEAVRRSVEQLGIREDAIRGITEDLAPRREAVHARNEAMHMLQESNGILDLALSIGHEPVEGGTE